MQIFHALCDDERPGYISVPALTERLLAPNDEGLAHTHARLKQHEHTTEKQPELTAAQNALGKRLISKLNFRKKSLSFAVRPLFRKAGGSSFLTHEEFKQVLGPGHLNLGLSLAEEKDFVAAADRTGKGVVTFVDLAALLGAADHKAPEMDPMTKSAARALEGHRCV